jgi:hypothetical protein
MNGITFWYLISLAIQNHLCLQLMNVVTAYLYGIPVLNVHANRNMYCVKFAKSLYDLKQKGWMWYDLLKEFLLNKWYSNSDDCPCVFTRRSNIGFGIIPIYVNDLNIIGHTNDTDEECNHLKTEFKMKDLGWTKIFLVLQLEHLHTSILVHQSAYVQKVLERFNMYKAYLDSVTPHVTETIIKVINK